MLLGISGMDGLTTIIGLAMVFVVLALLVGVLILMKLLPELIKKKFPNGIRKKDVEDKVLAASQDDIAEKAMAEENFVDNYEIVAAITAALTLVLQQSDAKGNISVAPFKVKSIKKINY